MASSARRAPPPQSGGLGLLINSAFAQAALRRRPWARPGHRPGGSRAGGRAGARVGPRRRAEGGGRAENNAHWVKTHLYTNLRENFPTIPSSDHHAPGQETAARPPGPATRIAILKPAPGLHWTVITSLTGRLLLSIGPNVVTGRKAPPTTPTARASSQPGLPSRAGVAGAEGSRRASVSEWLGEPPVPDHSTRPTRELCRVRGPSGRRHFVAREGGRSF